MPAGSRLGCSQTQRRVEAGCSLIPYEGQFAPGAAQPWRRAQSRRCGPSHARVIEYKPDEETERMKPAKLLEEDQTLAENVDRLVEVYRPQRIYLFGSKAREEAGPDIDYDLLVVVPDDAPAGRRESRLAYQALRGTGTAADVIVCTESWFEKRFHLDASLPATVVREGRLLHAA